MALSDVCFDFLHTIQEASTELAEGVDHYGDPTYPIVYGEEIGGLRAACQAIKDNDLLDEEAIIRLVRLAHSVLAYHDTPPFCPESEQRKARMVELIELFRTDLSPEDAALAEQAIAEIHKNDESVSKPAGILNAMVKKLGQSTYDIAIRVISDIASETAKKFMDLK